MIDATEVEYLKQWVGRSESRRELLGAFPARALAATLDQPDPLPQAGDLLPELWHWLYFLPSARLSETGPDGHPKRGGLLPPVRLPRRMWAGGRLKWHRPLAVGEELERVSTVRSVTCKTGRTGDLVFVLVEHVLSGRDGIALVEEQDIVYLDVAGQPAPGPVAARCAEPFDWCKEVAPTTALLFRYSALTFNGHRIHYDRDYATGVEGYPGLVVHGPLIATLLAGLARSGMPGRRLSAFEFRAVRPTFDLSIFRVKGRLGEDRSTARLWAEDEAGGLTMHATAQYDPGT